MLISIGQYLNSVESQPLAIAYSGGTTFEHAVFVFVDLVELDRIRIRVSSSHTQNIEISPAIVKTVKPVFFGLAVYFQIERNAMHLCVFVEHITVGHDGNNVKIVD